MNELKQTVAAACQQNGKMANSGKNRTPTKNLTAALILHALGAPSQHGNPDSDTPPLPCRPGALHSPCGWAAIGGYCCWA